MECDRFFNEHMLVCVEGLDCQIDMRVGVGADGDEIDFCSLDEFLCIMEQCDL